MKAEEVIKEYELFRGLTQEMLDGIEKDDWDRIGHISERREKLLQELMVMDDTLMTDSVERIRWSDLIRECLEMNGKMQALIEEKMGALQTNYLHEKKLLQTYHPHSQG